MVLEGETHEPLRSRPHTPPRRVRQEATHSDRRTYSAHLRLSSSTADESRPLRGGGSAAWLPVSGTCRLCSPFVARGHRRPPTSSDDHLKGSGPEIPLEDCGDAVIVRRSVSAAPASHASGRHLDPRLKSGHVRVVEEHSQEMLDAPTAIPCTPAQRCSDGRLCYTRYVMPTARIKSSPLDQEGRSSVDEPSTLHARVRSVPLLNWLLPWSFGQ